MAQDETCEITLEHKTTTFYCKGDQTLAYVANRSYDIPI